MDNPYGVLRLLQDRIIAEAKKLNVEPISIVFMPAENGSDFVQIIFKVLPEAVKTVAEIETDTVARAFEDMMENMQVVDEEPTEPKVSDEEQQLLDRLEETRKKLKGWSDD